MIRLINYFIVFVVFQMIMVFQCRDLLETLKTGFTFLVLFVFLILLEVMK